MGLVSLLTDISSESVSAILPVYVTTILGMSPLAYGVIDGLYQGVSATVRLAGGWVADQWDRPKWVAFVGYATSALTKLALLGAHGFGAITVIITADRLGKGLRTAPRDAVIAASAPPELLGRAYGVHRSLDTVGAAIGPLLAFTILWQLEGDFTAVFVVSFVAALLGLAVLGLLVPNVRPNRRARSSAGLAADSRATSGPAAGPTGPTHDAGQPRRPLRQAFSGPMRRLVAVAALLGVLTISDGFLYLSLQQRDDFAARYFPLLFVGANVAYFALAVPMGRLADRLGRSRVFVAGHVLLVGAYLCAASATGGVVTTVACLMLLGAFYAATDGVLAALTAEIAPPASRASCIAATQTSVAAGRFVSSLLFGVLWVRIGRGPGLLVVALALAVAIPVAWRLVGRAGAAPARVAA